MAGQQKMGTIGRILVAVGALLYLGVFVFPIWKISLDAPQYPEGLGMYIWINHITGERPNDLENINTLNHYIGMKEIDPHAIPEFDIMPWIVVGLVILGLIAAIAGSRKLVIAWIGLTLIAAALGIYDFWKWEYDYGHNLNPNAPIKIPGMSYQPPLLGTKQLLNITATSLPYWGTLLIIMGVLLGVLALVIDKKQLVKSSVVSLNSRLQTTTAETAKAV